MVEVKLKVDDIVKIKKFENAVVFYTEKNYWVCKPTQQMPTRNDLFITLKLKKGGNDYGKK